MITIIIQNSLSIIHNYDYSISHIHGSSVKCVDAFRIALTEEPKLLTKQKLG